MKKKTTHTQPQPSWKEDDFLALANTRSFLARWKMRLNAFEKDVCQNTSESLVDILVKSPECADLVQHLKVIYCESTENELLIIALQLMNCSEWELHLFLRRLGIDAGKFLAELQDQMKRTDSRSMR